MQKSLRNRLVSHYVNIRGWRTNRKIVVIESDDWGSVRMPSIEVFRKYIGLGYDISNNSYCNNDSLANTSDLEALFNILMKYRDRNGNYPVITFNTVMGNPDFQKIKNSNFTEYFFEPFTETLKRYYPKEDVFALWQQGMEEKLIRPQFHGREHVNVPIWLELLRNGNKPLLDAFELEFWCIPSHFYSNTDNKNIQASYNSADKKHIESYKKTVTEGMKLFNQTFGYKSTTFIANNFIWPMELNEVLSELGVKGLQGMHYQKIPDTKNPVRLYEIYTGKISDYNQVYTLRNCHFEPSESPEGFDNIGSCLKEIKTAFLWRKPAIITAHRQNFIGVINEANRKKNLKDFSILISEIIKRWPDVEFLSSDELTSEILK